MAESTSYSVSTNGSTVPGFELDDVINTFSSLFGVPREKAASYFEKPKLIKKNLSQKDAESYQERLVKIGVSVLINEHSAEGVRVVGTNSSASVNSLELVATDADTISSAKISAGFTCPKCQLSQDKTEQCKGCGIFYKKLHAKTTSSSHDSNQSNSTAHSVTPKTPLVNAKEAVVEEDTISFGTLVLPIIAAILGAFIWKLIAVNLGYELGLVAWGIGGAIGTAAAFAGGRGTTMGATCAVLALVAIFGGKYMIMSSYQSDLVDMFAGSGSEPLLQEVYDEATVDADAFSKISKDDNSIKTYMVSYHYTDAKFSSSVTDTELEDFKTYTQPWLESNSENKPGENKWDSAQLAEIEASITNISVMSMVFDSLGLLDIIFAFLGISTAFKLGLVGRSS